MPEFPSQSADTPAAEAAASAAGGIAPPAGDSLAEIADALAAWPVEWVSADVLPWGILTDPHGWPDRTRAVLDAFAALGIPPSRVVCLGDLVDYGPQPVAVVRQLKSVARVICGNHDVFAVSHEAMMNGDGMTADDWAFLSECVREWPYWRTTVGELFAGAELPESLAARSVLFVHDCPRAVEEGAGSAGNRVIREDHARREFAVMARLDVDVCFYGHTHARRIFRGVPDAEAASEAAIAGASRGHRALAGTPAGHKVEIESRPAVAFGSRERYLINVGSVSENRDAFAREPQAGVLTPWWFAHLRLWDYR